MKRILLSLAISLVLLAAYFLGAAILLEFVIGHSEEGSAFSIPLSLPLYALDYVYPYETDDDYVPSLVLASIANVVLYAFPIYGILSILARRKASDDASSDPPPPPTFDS